MENVIVLVEAEINPTETEENVKTAVTNMFGNTAIKVEPSHIGNILVAEAKSRGSLENFRNVLRRDRVRAAARRILNSKVRGNTVSFCLNKQVAFVGHVSFSQETGESPLGPIKITIETEKTRELIDWLAPRIA
jgi:predicted RNA binding protein with dsRBD fold (UPF0201 family)